MVWKEPNPPAHGPSTKWTKPSTPACHMSGWPRPTRPATTEPPGPNAYTLKPACSKQVESFKRSAPAYFFGHQAVVEQKPVHIFVRTTEVTAPQPSSLGRQPVSTATTAPAFSMSHRKSSMFGVKPNKRTPGPSDYCSPVTAGLANTPLLHRSPVVHFSTYRRDEPVDDKRGKGMIPGPDIYDSLRGLGVTKPTAPKPTIGRRIPVEGSSLTSRSNSYRYDSALGEQRASLRRSMPSISIGCGARIPIPGLAGWSAKTPGPGAYG